MEEVQIFHKSGLRNIDLVSVSGQSLKVYTYLTMMVRLSDSGE